MCGQNWLKSRGPDPIADKNWSKMFGIFLNITAPHTSRFALLTSSQFLHTLSHPPRTTVDDSMLSLTQEDHDIFEALNTRRSDINKVVAVLTGKKKGVEDDEVDIQRG